MDVEARRLPPERVALRNARERRRAHGIAQQIDSLHAILTGAGVACDNKKYDVLACAHAYIIYLRQRIHDLETAAEIASSHCNTEFRDGDWGAEMRVVG